MRPPICQKKNKADALCTCFVGITNTHGRKPRVFEIFVGLLTSMFGRQNRRRTLPAFPAGASDSLSRKDNALHGYSTAAGRKKRPSRGRVPVFHRIPLFSRTRIACSAPKERSRASATKSENDSIIRVILSLLPDFVKRYPKDLRGGKKHISPQITVCGEKGKRNSVLHGCFFHCGTADGGKYDDGAAQKQDGHAGQQQISVLAAVNGGAGQIVGEVGLGSGHDGGDH